MMILTMKTITPYLLFGCAAQEEKQEDLRMAFNLQGEVL